jgi:hypothetical protein
MYEQFIQNCPELWNIENERLQKHVQTVWKDQIENKSLIDLETEGGIEVFWNLLGNVISIH